MKIEIEPSKIQGQLQAPASKSMLQRAIAAAFLSEAVTTLNGFTSSADAEAALRLVQDLGQTVQRNGNSLVFSSKNRPKTNHLNIGESGLGIRLFSPILALTDQQYSLDARGTLRKRPLILIENVLNALGAKCETDNGFAPIRINGPMKTGMLAFNSSEGSQLLSGLLMALPKAKFSSELLVSNLKSKPYIDMTMRLLADFGINIIQNDYNRFVVPGNQTYFNSEYTVEGDWSGAAFLLVAAAINGSVRIENLRADSFQGDKQIVDVLKKVGATVNQLENSLFVQKNQLKAFEFDATESPDLFPPLAALAAACKGISRIKGVHRLKHKESNRAEAIQQIFDTLGLHIELVEDEMIIDGKQARGGRVSSFQDHRMAMMAAILGLSAENSVEISESESVEKSYPHFFDDLHKLGAKWHYLD